MMGQGTQLIGQTLNMNVSRYRLLSQVRSQCLEWRKGFKGLANGLSRIGSVGLPGLDCTRSASAMIGSG